MKWLILLICLTSNCFAYDYEIPIRFYPENPIIENPIRYYDYFPNNYISFDNFINKQNKCSEEEILKYNPYNNVWSYEKPNSRLRYNPYMGYYEFAE